MVFRIHMMFGSQRDSLDIEGDSIEEIREDAHKEIEKRNPDQYWSERLGE